MNTSKSVKSVKVAYLTWEDSYEMFEDGDLTAHPELILKHPDVKIISLESYQQGVNGYYSAMSVGLPPDFSDLVCTRYFFTES